MARVVFIQNPWFEFLGPMYISAALKAEAHDCDLYIGNSAGDFLLELWRNKPDLLAFSVMTGMHKWVLEVASQLKQELSSDIGRASSNILPGGALSAPGGLYLPGRR